MPHGKRICGEEFEGRWNRSTASAEASFADLQAMRLSIQAELALNYFQLRILDNQKKNLEDAVAAY